MSIKTPVAPAPPKEPSAVTPSTSIVDTVVASANSTNIFAKLGFILLVGFIFIILLRITIMGLSYIFNKTSSPHIFDGMLPGNSNSVFEQDPNQINAKTIPLSVNQSQGIEFSWSCWIFINKLPGTGQTYGTIFTKGDGLAPNPNSPVNQSSISKINCPGLYLDPSVNQLVMAMSSYNNASNYTTASTYPNELLIPNIPFQKWIHILIRCEQNTIDVYVNGMIANTLEFVNDIPRQNYGNVYVGTSGGFDGFISNLWYYDYALNAMDIQGLVAKGPTTTLATNSPQNTILSTDSNYFSSAWYMS